MDTATLTSLKEQRAAITAKQRSLYEAAEKEGRVLSAEEQEQDTKMEADWAVFNDRISRAEKILHREAAERSAAPPAGLPNGQPTPGREDAIPANARGSQRKQGEERRDVEVTKEMRSLCLQAWVLRQGGEGLKKRHVDACKSLNFNPNKRNLTIRLYDPETYTRFRGGSWEQRSTIGQNIVSGPQGSYLVPNGFVYNLEMALLQYGPMMAEADVMRTATGAEMPWPTVNDTGNEGTLISDAIPDTVSTLDANFGQVKFYAHEYTSGFVKVSAQLMQDSAFNLETTLGGMLGERLGRILNRHFTTGDAASKPQGIMVGSTVGTTSASSTAIAADELISHEHTVDPAYRDGAKWMFHDNIFAALKKLKDSQNRYLFIESLRAGDPDQLLGHAVTINQHMDSTIATTKKTMLFGPLNKYKIRMVQDITLRRADERFIDTNQVGFVAFVRADGKVLDAGTHPIRYFLQV